MQILLILIHDSDHFSLLCNYCLIIEVLVHNIVNQNNFFNVNLLLINLHYLYQYPNISFSY